MVSAEESPPQPKMGWKAVGTVLLGLASCCVPVALLFPEALFALLGVMPLIGWHAVQALVALAGIIAGVQALREIRRSQGRMRGRGLARLGVGINLAAALVITPAVLYGKVLPVVVEARNQKQSMANLKAIVTALHKYHDDRGRFPPVIVYNREGKPLYSWRVLLLPFLGQNKLFEQFKLDEAWDSPTNQPLLARMPAEYAPPGERFPPADFATHYLVFDGPGAVFDRGGRPKWLDDPINAARIPGMQVHPQRPGDKPVYDFGGGSRMFSITDGTAFTILLVEADDRVPWSKPQDLPYAADKPLPGLGKHYGGDFIVAMADGSVRIVSRKVSEKTIRAAITANGGEILAPGWEAP
jgi:hypothetical protein